MLFEKTEYKEIMLPFIFADDPADLEAGGISIEAYGNVFGEMKYCLASYELKKPQMYDNGDYGQMIDLLKKLERKDFDTLARVHGKGYGKTLMDRAVEELKQAGYRRILLWGLEENHRARRFYETYGFALSGEKLRQNIGGKELSEVMYLYQA